MYFGFSKPLPLDPVEAWKNEAKMGKRSRRARYHCHSNYIRLIDIKPWPIYYKTYFDENVHDVPEPPPEPPKEQPKPVEAPETHKQEVVEAAAQQEKGEVPAFREAPAKQEAPAPAPVQPAAAEAPVQPAAKADPPKEEPAKQEAPKPADPPKDAPAKQEAPAPAPVQPAAAETPVQPAAKEEPAKADPPKEAAPAKQEAPAPAAQEPPKAEPAKPAEPPKAAQEPPKPTPPADSSSSSSSDEDTWPRPNKMINRKISHWTGNICTLEIDAIVNAANSSLLGGGGIDGAIHNAAGEELYRECLTLNGTPTGTTKITRGYDLPAKFILHTVGPQREDPEKLTSCYNTVLELVKKHKIRSVALCGISTGIFGYPLEPASRVACTTVRKWLEIPENLESIDRIIFCTFLKKEEDCYDKLLQEYFPIESDPEFVNIWGQMESGYKSSEELTESSSSSSVEEEAPAKVESEEEDDNAPVSDVVFGSVDLKDGEAVVTVPAAFQKKWDDFYYQVTPIGKYAKLFIKDELENGKFTIASPDKVDVRVHWQVRGDD